EKKAIISSNSYQTLHRKINIGFRGWRRAAGGFVAFSGWHKFGHTASFYRSACVTRQLFKSEIPTVSSCELERNPARYDQRFISVHGVYAETGGEYSNLYDPSCLSNPTSEEDEGLKLRLGFRLMTLMNGRPACDVTTPLLRNGAAQGKTTVELRA